MNITRSHRTTKVLWPLIAGMIFVSFDCKTQKPYFCMPIFWKGRNLIQFAASQKHIGLYPGPEAVEAFTDRLAAFPTSKGTIRLPLNQPMPLELIADIARWCEDAYGK